MSNFELCPGRNSDLAYTRSLFPVGKIFEFLCGFHTFNLPISSCVPVADPDLELGEGGGGAVLIFLPCWPSSLKLQSFFLSLPKIMGGGRGPGPLP